MVYSSVSGFGVTAGAHRLWSHRSYKAKFPLRLLLAVMQTATGFDTIYNWAAIHRVHHRYSDTDADPHNVRRGFWHAHTWWMLMLPHPAIARAHDTIDTSDLLADPIVKYQHKFYWFWYGIFGVGVTIAVPMYFWDLPWYLAVMGYFTRTVGKHLMHTLLDCELANHCHPTRLDPLCIVCEQRRSHVRRPALQ